MHYDKTNKNVMKETQLTKKYVHIVCSMCAQ